MPPVAPHRDPSRDPGTTSPPRDGRPWSSNVWVRRPWVLPCCPSCPTRQPDPNQGKPEQTRVNQTMQPSPLPVSPPRRFADSFSPPSPAPSVFHPNGYPILPVRQRRRRYQTRRCISSAAAPSPGVRPSPGAATSKRSCGSVWIKRPLALPLGVKLTRGQAQVLPIVINCLAGKPVGPSPGSRFKALDCNNSFRSNSTGQVPR